MINSKSGFTFIELLVVFALLAILLVATILAINPLEQLAKSEDDAVKAVARDLRQAAVSYFTHNKVTPWESSSACNQEITLGGALSGLEDCIDEIVNGSNIRNKFLSKSYVNDMQVTQCGTTAIVCYDPKSLSESQKQNAKYTQSGVINSSCPGDGSGSCYWCEPIVPRGDCSVELTPN